LSTNSRSPPQVGRVRLFGFNDFLIEGVEGLLRICIRVVPEEVGQLAFHGGASGLFGLDIAGIPDAERLLHFALTVGQKLGRFGEGAPFGTDFPPIDCRLFRRAPRSGEKLPFAGLPIRLLNRHTQGRGSGGADSKIKPSRLSEMPNTIASDAVPP